MTRHDENSLEDILEAIEAIREYLKRGTLSDKMVYDAIRARIIDIGEAVRNTRKALLDKEPEIPWRQIKDMRNHLTHSYFNINEAVIADVVYVQLRPLQLAVSRLLSN